MEKIKLKATEILQTFMLVQEVMQSNGQPFQGQAKRLLWDMESDAKFAQSVSQEDLEAIEKDIGFGEKIVAPQSFPEGYRTQLEKVCKDLPEKKSKLEEIING